MKSYKATLTIKDKFSLAESPFYDERTGLVSFVDIPKGNLILINHLLLDNGVAGGEEIECGELKHKEEEVALAEIEHDKKSHDKEGVALAGVEHSEMSHDKEGVALAGVEHSEMSHDKEGVALADIEHIEIILGEQAGAAVPMTEPGKYLMAGTVGLYEVSEGAEPVKILDTTDLYESFQRSNDAKCDSVGRLYFGSSVLDDSEPSGNLFRYDKGSVKIMEANTKISNGMAWSKDKKKFYFSDSPFNAIFEYDYDINTGDLTNRRVLCEITNGVPDGLCIDDEDNLWIAIWGGRRVEHRSGATGELLGVIEVDANNVTSCCFYGENYDKLLITSSGDNEDGAGDGRIFTCKVEARGLKADVFVK